MLTKSSWLVAGALALSLSANAGVLFQNNTQDLGSSFTDGTLEFGNEIFLTSPGYITNFSFEYYGVGGAANGTFAGSVTVDVRWYLNNGTLSASGLTSPGSKLYDSGALQIAAPHPVFGSYAGALDFSTTTGDFPVAGPGGTNGLFVPANQLTFTVQFAGMGTGDSAGVELFGAPTVGAAYSDYWENDAGVWTLKEDPSVSAVNIGQEWMGTAVPEPSTLALSLVGGLSLFMAVRRFRNK
jgi:hypothetical protein